MHCARRLARSPKIAFGSALGRWQRYARRNERIHPAEKSEWIAGMTQSRVKACPAYSFLCPAWRHESEGFQLTCRFGPFQRAADDCIRSSCRKQDLPNLVRHCRFSHQYARRRRHACPIQAKQPCFHTRSVYYRAGTASAIRTQTNWREGERAIQAARRTHCSMPPLQSRAAIEHQTAPAPPAPGPAPLRLQGPSPLPARGHATDPAAP